jgi:hypothetical protein
MKYVKGFDVKTLKATDIEILEDLGVLRGGPFRAKQTRNSRKPLNFYNEQK